MTTKKQKRQPDKPNRGWRKRMLGVACPECHGSGGGKNTKRAFVGLESTWMLYTTTCSACKGSGYEFKPFRRSGRDRYEFNIATDQHQLREAEAKLRALPEPDDNSPTVTGVDTGGIIGEVHISSTEDPHHRPRY